MVNQYTYTHYNESNTSLLFKTTLIYYHLTKVIEYFTVYDVDIQAVRGRVIVGTTELLQHTPPPIPEQL